MKLGVYLQPAKAVCLTPFQLLPQIFVRKTMLKAFATILVRLGNNYPSQLVRECVHNNENALGKFHHITKTYHQQHQLFSSSLSLSSSAMLFLETRLCKIKDFHHICSILVHLIKPKKMK